MPRPTQTDAAIDEIEDVYDDRWLVVEYRPAPNGFAVAIGWPAETRRGGPRTIMTAALAEYLQGVERPRDIDLPIGRSTIKRLRAELDLRYDHDAWWAAREADLRSMTLDAFATRHNCSAGAASQRRAALAAKTKQGRHPEG